MVKDNSFMEVSATGLRSIVCLLFLCALCVVSKADNKTDSIKHAVRILKGMDKDRSNSWAVSVLRSAAEDDSIAYAMNSLGMAYMAGIGVEQDSIQCVYWLEKAADRGFREAYHNLGRMYKNSYCGVKQDFFKSYRYFEKGAEKNSVLCIYDMGFMLYKGLGCGQDYQHAAELFQKASNRDYSPALYMLGLCYRNGYGVEADTAKANFYLKRSAALGYRYALEELYRPHPENYMHDDYIDSATYGNVPENMPDISPEVNDTSLLAGEYQGFVVMYDWSGEYVLGEKPVMMTMERDKDGIDGITVFGNDTVPFRATISKEGKLQFSEGDISLCERYYPSGKVKYRMDYAIFDIWQDNIKGELRLYSLWLNEPERPMYLELHRKGSDILSADDRFGRITISPNPFSSTFTANFELLTAADAKVKIFDKYGALVYSRSLGNLQAGINSLQISPDILQGTYVLNITAGKQVLRTIIVKNGGM